MIEPGSDNLCKQPLADGTECPGSKKVRMSRCAQQVVATAANEACASARCLCAPHAPAPPASSRLVAPARRRPRKCSSIATPPFPFSLCPTHALCTRLSFHLSQFVRTSARACGGSQRCSSSRSSGSRSSTLKSPSRTLPFSLRPRSPVATHRPVQITVGARAPAGHKLSRWLLRFARPCRPAHARPLARVGLSAWLRVDSAPTVYRLSGAMFHLGPLPNQGHYVSIVFDPNMQCYFLMNVRAAPRAHTPPHATHRTLHVYSSSSLRARPSSAFRTSAS